MVESVHLKRRTIVKITGPKLSMSTNKRNHARRSPIGAPMIHRRAVNIVPTTFHHRFNRFYYTTEMLCFVLLRKYVPGMSLTVCLPPKGSHRDV